MNKTHNKANLLGRQKTPLLRRSAFLLPVICDGNSMEHDLDKEARKKLALLVRRLASGSITNDQFEDQLPESDETALHDIYFYGVWPLYDDFVEHKLKNQWALSQEGKESVSRIVLFLRSGNPYRYPVLIGFTQIPVMFLSIITLGWFGRFWLKSKWKDGDQSVWPFFSRSEYEEALKHPVFLNGSGQKDARVGRSATMCAPQL